MLERIWPLLLLSLATAPGWAAGLDDLEMDVLAPGEFPGRAVPRITLPRVGHGGEPLRPVVPGLPAEQRRHDIGFTLDSSDQVRQSSSVSRDTLEAARDRAGLPGRPEGPALTLEP